MKKFLILCFISLMALRVEAQQFDEFIPEPESKKAQNYVPDTFVQIQMRDRGESEEKARAKVKELEKVEFIKDDTPESVIIFNLHLHNLMSAHVKSPQEFRSDLFIESMKYVTSTCMHYSYASMAILDECGSENLLNFLNAVSSEEGKVSSTWRESFNELHDTIKAVNIEKISLLNAAVEDAMLGEDETPKDLFEDTERDNLNLKKNKVIEQ